jgi:hypothetical protein
MSEPHDHPHKPEVEATKPAEAVADTAAKEGAAKVESQAAEGAADLGKKAASKEGGFLARTFLKDAKAGVSFANVNKVSAAVAAGVGIAGYMALKGGGNKEQNARA